MSYTYQTWVNALLNEVVAYSSDPNWTNALPTFIDYAEQRIYRELDIFQVHVVDTSLTLSSGVETYTSPSFYGPFISLDQVIVYTPSSAGTAGTANVVVPVSLSFNTFAYPSNLSSNCGVPEFFALIGSTNSGQATVNINFGPTPDQAYATQFEGAIRPTPLSSNNASTFLTTYYPDLWFAATMVAASAFMRNFGSQADNPAQAVSWEAQYQTLFKSADVEQARLQFRSQAWGTEQPRQVTTPPRT